jgi:OmcA/MtrC family decaheme c-type cytochrome
MNDLYTALFNRHLLARGTRSLPGLCMLIAALLLSGCEGSDGADGTDGKPGLPAGVDISNAEELNAVITGASIASPAVVSFKLSDGNGNPVRNLPASAIGFNLAKLVPGTDGNPSAWQSYINKIEQPGVGPGTEPQPQAETENGTAGTLVDNLDGTYTYTFSFDINNVTTPVAVDYVPTLTHRVTFEIRGFAPVNNPVYDWRPSDNATSGLFSREITKTATCNVCHDNLALHGGARFEVQECVTCHNPGSADANSGNTVDMTVMTHKIHYGANLPSVEAGGSYCIYGFFDSIHCYDDVVYPQDIRNCRNCHDENDPQTPDAANWYTNPYDAACGSCHDDVNFNTGENHAGIAANNTECSSCHTRDQSPPSRLEVRQAHRMLAVEETANYRFDLLNIDFVPPAGGPSTPTVTFAVSNPQLGDPLEQSARYDLATEIDNSSTLNLRVAWPTVDYSNAGAGTNNAQPQSAAVYASGSLSPQVIPNGDLTYNLAVGAVPDGTTGSGVVILEGSINTAAGKAPVTAASKYFGITDEPAQPRRAAVDIERCNDCHEVTSAHRDNRNNAIEDCQVCHNANAARGGTPSRGPMDMKYFIHRIHAVDDIRYPQRTSNCLACHTDDGFYTLAADSGVLATSTNSGDPDAPSPSPSDPSDNNRISPNSSACSLCHTHSSATAEAHMIQNGGWFDACQDADGTLRRRINFCGADGDQTGALVVESCSVCHAAGRSADVARAHKLAL